MGPTPPKPSRTAPKLKVTDGYTGDLKGWSLGLPAYENQRQMAIPDAAGAYVELWTKADGLVGSASNKLEVYVDASHQYLANLKIDLVAPDGSAHLLQLSGQINRAGDLKKVYTVGTSAVPANGWWKLRVDDVPAGDTGQQRRHPLLILRGTNNGNGGPRPPRGAARLPLQRKARE
ncbi:proprotein convertase P-domain-containing protein [Streptomyces sp. AP-93]|uniref:proprotein convertase P-domain-containing protein n=1 Tax=Streptomyces sp. AP-93 TaxID=2929048 RepID=UPI001FAE8E02|nr:proprotein convertase P-domain-containing protein [Streptomyces sp. AP-93]MCJ0869486.1 proprotein convertase P-domain-containing protein [Streptomyces sp. AP-93]